MSQAPLPAQQNNFHPAVLAFVDQYINTHEINKLHIGCGFRPLDGWLNADYQPRFPNIIPMDATQIFPIPDNSFDYIYSEHMIEHVPFFGGLAMLKECYRVLKPGGHIRICAPDLAFLIALYNKDKTDIQQRYIKWTLEQEPDTPFQKDVIVINNYFRKWGHSFIYDEIALRVSMTASGFGDIVRTELQQSTHKHLQNLANDKRMPEGFLALESMTLEATKPGA